MVGLRRKERKSSGGEVAIVFRMGRRYGREEEKFVHREADKSNVIGLADAGDVNGTEIDTKLGELGHDKLGIVGHFVEMVAQNSTLLHTETIVYWSLEAFVPFNKCLAVCEAVVEEN